MVLKTLIGKADEKGIPGKFTWDELNRFMTNVGQEELDYEAFKMTFDADPNLQQLIKNFDQNGIELKTKNQEIDTAPSDATQGNDSVAAAAKRATAKAQAS